MYSICRAIIIEFPPPHKADAGGGLSKKGPTTASGIRKNFRVLLTQGDLSRLGRNYIEVGRLTEDLFPEHEIRLVAVSDGIDTDEGENELAPIKNLFKNKCCLGRVSAKALRINKVA